MIFELERNITANEDITLTWRLAFDWRGFRSIYIFDVNGHGLSLNRHLIGMDGLVRPSVVCPICGWHETIKLKGWTESLTPQNPRGA